MSFCSWVYSKSASSSKGFRSIACLLTTAFCLAASACYGPTSAEVANPASPETSVPILVGTNFEITGALPKVGEAATNAADLFVKLANDSGGVEVGGRMHPIRLIRADNRDTVEGAVAATKELISGKDVLAMVGPNVSNLAIPSGEIANELKTPMISPWSTNPETTLNRPWVYRASYTDSFQGSVLAEFATQQFRATRACVLFAEDNAFSRDIAESFRKVWEGHHGTGSVVAYEAFSTGTDDLSAQLTRIRDAGCDFLFLPQYANEVPAIVHQAHDVGITVPILGADSWAGTHLVEDCGGECDGYFFSKHFTPKGATGIAKTFVDAYKAEYGTAPGDIAALTWDAMRLLKQALQNCGRLTGDLATDRQCIRDGMSEITDFEGVTSTFSYRGSNDPVKCVTIVQIENGELTFSKSVCPAG